MKISDLLRLSTDNLRRRKGRTALTVIGVVVGTFSIIVMISLGIASNAQNEAMLQSWGDLTQITINNYQWGAASGDVPVLDDKMLDQLRSYEHVVAVTPMYQDNNLNAQIYAGKNDRYEAYAWNMYGVDMDALQAMDYQLISGSFVADDLNLGKKKIPVLIGEHFAYEFQDTRKSPNSGKRQRYWGEPIPIVHCDKCGYVPIDESELPLRLPMVESYEPTDNGESPLAKMTDWLETTCPCCGGKAMRETDTMPQWAGSSWYFLRYMDPHNDKALASKEAIKYWSPVDWYNGGMEHTTLHLLYSRFWHKFLYDIGVVNTPEPYAKRTSHGMILGENGEKMSKSRGNVVNPDEIVDEYGADTLRLYEMFIGDFEKAAPWSQSSIRGCRRFIERYYNLQTILNNADGIRPELESSFHKAIKKVGDDIENIKFNTAIATLMALINDITATGAITKEELRIFTILLNPFAPHVTEEVFEMCKLGDGIVAEQKWPEYDEAKCKDETIEIVVQVNGKIKTKLNIPVESEKNAVLDMAKADANVAKAIENMNIIKEIYVPNKLVNLVVKP